MVDGSFAWRSARHLFLFPSDLCFSFIQALIEGLFVWTLAGYFIPYNHLNQSDEI